MISKKSIQEVLDATHVEDVVGEFVGLKRRGVNMIGLCPFHGEKTPSFNVSPARNIFKCFGCGKGGDAITFLKEHENMSFEDAVRWIAKKYNIKLEEIELTDTEIQERLVQDSLYLINDFAVDFYQRQMLETDLGRSVALQYFKERGFIDDTIQKFSLGWAPEVGDAFTKAAIAAGYKSELLKKLKLTSESNRDFFRSRVMFPIQSLTGKVVGFAGRTLSNDKGTPKYINSPESEIYIKSKVLYGLFQAKKAIQQHDQCIIVEGYADVIALHQAGIENVIAPCGTSLVESHAALIKRLSLSKNVVFLFDGDKAGIAAASRNIKVLISQDLILRIVILPDGEDPDSYIKIHGAQKLREYISENSQDFIFYKIERDKELIEKNPLEIQRVLTELMELIAACPAQSRPLYVTAIRQNLKIDEEKFYYELKQFINKKFDKELKSADKQGSRASDFPSAESERRYNDIDFVTQPRKSEQQQTNKTYGHELQERDIIRILIAGGDKIYDKNQNISVAEYILVNIQEVINDFDNKVFENVAKECLELLSQGKVVNFQYFIQHPDETMRKLAVDLTTSPDDYSPNWIDRWNLPLQFQKVPEENFTLDTEQSLKHFLLRRVIRLCEKNQEEIKKLGNGDNMEQLIIAMKAQQKLAEMRNSIAKELGVVVLK
jgi:DNA primase